MAKEAEATDCCQTNQLNQENSWQVPENNRDLTKSSSAKTNNPSGEQQEQPSARQKEANLSSQSPELPIDREVEVTTKNNALQNKDNFQAIFEQANIGIAFIATTGQFLRVNSFLCSLLQYSASTMCSFTFQDITHANDLKTVWQCVDRTLNNINSSNRVEQRYLRRDGQWQWVSISLSLVKNTQNIPLYLVATIQDIQSRKQAEAKLLTRLDIDIAIAQISRKLVSTKEINYQELLGIIGKATKCDRVYLICFDRGYRACSTHHWSKDSKISQIQPQTTTIHQLPWWQGKLNKDEDIIINDINHLSGLTQAEKNILQSLNISSALIVPIFNEFGRIWGTLGLYNQAQNYRDWTKEDARQLRILGTIIQSNYKYRIARTKLKASETLSAQFFHHSVDGIFLIDRLPDGKLVYKTANPAYAKLLGKTNQEIECKTISELLPAEIAPFVEKKCRLCLALKKPLDFLLTLELKGKTCFWHIYLVPIKNYSGHYFSLQGSVKDITAEKQVIERQTRYRQLLRSITFKIRQSLDIQEILRTTVSDLQKTFNADRVLLFQFLPTGIGKVIEESVTFGFPSISEKAIIDRYCQDVLPDKYTEGYAYICEDIDNDRISSSHRAFLKKYQIKANLVLPISRYLPIEDSPSSSRQSSQRINKLWGILCVQQCSQSRQWTQDEIELLQHLVGQLTIALSQAELLESEIIQRKELARSNAELEQFAYIASHDLQAPLQTVSNYVQLLQRRYQSQLDNKGEKFIYYINDGVHRMRTQINDLLEYSRVGRQKSTLRTTDCNLIVEQAIANLRSEIEKNQAVVIYCNNLPTIVADPSQLIVLFQNLISNAIKYRSSATPAININASLRGDYWQFSVSDNGIGIESQYQQRIFQIFQRLHTQEEYPGTGIGLAICQKIVEHHGGKIKVKSQLNKGSDFYFTIPV